tara:strand:- start:5190 stop:7379 length:2190 start_codon:yes stop_codon:yes gene_type:complete
MFAHSRLRCLRFTPLLLGALMLAACGSSGGGSAVVGPGATGPAPDSKLLLKSFVGAPACSNFEAYLGESFTEQFLASFRCFGIGPCPEAIGFPIPVPTAPVAAPEDLGTDGGAPRSPDRVSQTNTQESDVDEADLVKADSNGRVYLAGGDRLRVVSAFPPEGLRDRPVVDIPLSVGMPGRFSGQALLLDEAQGQLVVLGQRFIAQQVRAESVLVNVQNPDQPVVMGRVAVDGYPVEARRINQRVHRFSRFTAPFPQAAFDDTDLLTLRDDYFAAESEGRQDDADALKAEVRARMTEVVRQAGAAAFLPRRYDDGVATALPCEAVVAPEVPSDFGLAVLQSFNLDGSAHAVSAAVNNAFLFYASARNLYLAQNSAGWFFAPDQPDETVIHRFALSDTAAPEYRGLGRVPGSPPDRFAFSEFDGHLRVATTAFQFSEDGRNFSNHLRVLRLDSGGLSVAGQVDGYAPGETTRGVRFIGGRGFVVTFEQIDPLFAFDLTDPQQPRIVSALKIPGFSSYLQPLGDEYLLTIGRGGDDEQLNGRVAVQLFDVANLADVRQVAVIEPAAGDNSYSYSSAEYDARAFTYFPDTTAQAVPGTLAFPLRVFDGAADFAGFMVVRVDPEGEVPLAALSRVDHAVLQTPADCDQRGGGGVSPGQVDGDAFAPPPCGATFIDPLRTVFMQDAVGTYLYTLSTQGIVAVNAQAPEETLGVLPLAPVDNDCIFCDVSITTTDQ